MTSRTPVGHRRLASGPGRPSRPRAASASIVLVVVLLAAVGCLRPDPTPPAASCAEQEAPQEPTGAPLAGASIMSWAEQIVELPNGSLRPRVPSDLEHACTADWLEQALTVDGWRVVRSDFAGQDYMDLPKGSVQSHIDGGSCREEDRQEVPDMKLTNLAAVWSGASSGQEDRRTLLLAAHWDAKEDDDEGGGPVPAANDGASGVAVLLALQRHIAAQDISFPFDVAVAFFDAEDGFADCHPLAGSIHFAQTMPIDVDRLILLDMVGDPDARFPREGHSVNSDPALVDLIWSKADGHGLGENFVDQQKTVGGDDHVPFIEVGVPAVDIIDFARPAGEGRFGFPPYWHLPGDTLDNLSGDFMADIAALVLDVVQDPAFTQQWPERA